MSFNILKNKNLQPAHFVFHTAGGMKCILQFMVY